LLWDEFGDLSWDVLDHFSCDLLAHLSWDDLVDEDFFVDDLFISRGVSSEDSVVR